MTDAPFIAGVIEILVCIAIATTTVFGLVLIFISYPVAVGKVYASTKYRRYAMIASAIGLAEWLMGVLVMTVVLFGETQG